MLAYLTVFDQKLIFYFKMIESVNFFPSVDPSHDDDCFVSILLYENQENQINQKLKWNENENEQDRNLNLNANIIMDLSIFNIFIISQSCTCNY